MHGLCVAAKRKKTITVFVDVTSCDELVMFCLLAFGLQFLFVCFSGGGGGVLVTHA